MKIIVDKVVAEEWMREACKFTSGKDATTMTLERIYRNEHSPMRTQRFMVRMYDIPSFVSVHFVRHDVGLDHFTPQVEPKDDTVHFVKSLRDDRGGAGKEGRWEPVNHMMDVNAQALVNMARKRLCAKAHPATRKIMQMIKDNVAEVDQALAVRMVPECVYRMDCHEEKSCGYLDRWLSGNDEAIL